VTLWNGGLALLFVVHWRALVVSLVSGSNGVRHTAIIATHDVHYSRILRFLSVDFSLHVWRRACHPRLFGERIVVVFDRIRENFRKMRNATTPQIIDNAITRTMSRTIITHGSTQLAVLSMLMFGGETLHYFALALTIGILFGIYSSVLVASPIVMWLGLSARHVAAKKEVGEADTRP